MRNFKKALSLCLVLVMLCSVMSISAFASNDDPYVTVYITEGMFTEGGYDDNAGEPIIQTFMVGEDPSDYLMSGYTAISFNRSDINTTTTRAYYNSSLTGSANVLDAIIHALRSKTQTPVCYWDTWNSPNGGYVYSFSPDGIPETYDTEQDTKNGVLYDVYSGTGLKVAFTQANGTVDEPTNYATNYTLTDNMVIVLDMSDYVIYYPAWTGSGE